MYPNVNIAGGGLSNSSTSSTPQISLAVTDARYLNEAGGDQMGADLNLGNHKILNVTDPINSSDAATKNYVDTSNALNVKFDGSVHNVNLQSGRMYNLTDPINFQDAATKNYVDTADNLRLKRDETNVMTGNLDMNSKKII